MKLNPNRKVSYSLKQIRKIKADAYAKGHRQAMKEVWMIPLIVLRDKYGFGPKRMTEYIQAFDNEIGAVNEGYLKIEDIKQMLRDEVGIDLEGLDD